MSAAYIIQNRNRSVQRGIKTILVPRDRNRPIKNCSNCKAPNSLRIDSLSGEDGRNGAQKRLNDTNGPSVEVSDFFFNKIFNLGENYFSLSVCLKRRVEMVTELVSPFGNQKQLVTKSVLYIRLALVVQSKYEYVFIRKNKKTRDNAEDNSLPSYIFIETIHGQMQKI